MSNVDLRDGHTAPGFPSKNRGALYFYEVEKDFSKNNVDSGDVALLADIPAGFKPLYVDSRVETAEGSAATAAIKIGATSLVASLDLNSVGNDSNNTEVPALTEDSILSLTPGANLANAKVKLLVAGHRQIWS